MAAILDAILNFTPSARDPDCPPKFFFTYLGVYYQDQESKCREPGTSDCTRDPLIPRTIWYFSSPAPAYSIFEPAPLHFPLPLSSHALQCIQNNRLIETC